MKAAFLYEKNDLRIEQTEVPEIGNYEILLKVRNSFVCGTDVRMYLNGHKGVTPQTPLVIGHEMSGIIYKVGSNVPYYEEGMRVAVAPNMGCGTCDICIGGNTQLCPNYRALGIHFDGSFADFVKIPEDAIRQGNLVEIPDAVSFEDAALVEPLSCAYNAFQRTNIRPGDTVLIIGAGPIGLMHAKLAKMGGASKVMINDLSEDRLKRCQELDSSLVIIKSDSLKEQIYDLTNGKGVDVTITANPAPQPQILSLELAAINGRICFFGGLPADKANVPLNTNIIHYKQLIVTGTTRQNLRQYREVLGLIASQQLVVSDLISSQSQLEDLPQTIQQIARGQGLKSSITFN